MDNLDYTIDYNVFIVLKIHKLIIWINMANLMFVNDIYAIISLAHIYVQL